MSKQELRRAVKRAMLAAYGDSNDREIDLLKDALDQALNLLGIAVELTDAEIERASA